MTTSDSPLAVEFRGVSKTFGRSAKRTLLRTRISEFFSRAKHERFHALRNVSFQLRRGESLAVVGSNGAGKSTLLSLVTRLSCPDEGQVEVRGRVAALLELGSGFHPDLSGRENVYLNASLIGLSRKKTDLLFDSIVEFSGLAEFINEPLRTYSTGMVMRLAFSVSMNMDPDILVIDEILAVGDKQFQTKCFERIQEFRRSGKTFLFVSHGAAIEAQCERALWLDHGQVMMDGKVKDVLEAYQGRASVPV